MARKQMTVDELVQSEGWKKFTKNLEIYGSIAGAVGFILHFIKSPYATMLLTLSLTTLAIVYFFMAFLKADFPSRALSYVFYKLYGFGLSISLVTIMFILNHWPAAHLEMLIISFALTLANFILVFMARPGFERQSLSLLNTRLVITLVLLVYCIFAAKIYI